MIRSAMLALLLAGGTAPVVVAGDSAMRERWNRPKSPFRVIGTTWYIGTQGITMLLIRGNEGAVLIDAGLPESTTNLRASLAALEVDPAEIKLILTSHAHFDHVGALAELKALTGARVIASIASAKQLAAGGKGDPHFGNSGPYAAVVVDATIDDGETITLGELSFIALLTPGHTPGSTTWRWQARDTANHSDHGDHGTVHVVYADSITAPGYRLLDDQAVLDDFRRSFARLRAIPCDVLITPHPEASELFARVDAVTALEQASKQTPALIDATACTRYADRAERALDTQIAQQRKVRNVPSP